MSKEKSRRLAKFLLAAVTLVFLWYVRRALTPFLFATVIAYVLEPPVEYMVSKKVPRPMAIIAMYLLLGALITALVTYVVPGFVAEFNRLSETFPNYSSQAIKLAYDFYSRYRGAAIPDSIRLAIDQSLAELQGALLVLSRNLVSRLMETLSGFAAFLISPILAFYILNDLPEIRRSIFGFMPRGAGWSQLLVAIDNVIKGFIRGQILVGIFVGIAVGIVLSAFGVGFPLLLGVLAAVGELVPYFGPVLAALPAIALAFSKSMITGLEVAIVLVAIQQIDSTIIYPKVVGKGVGLHPLSVVFAVLVGGYVAGFWGMFLAVPVAGILREVVKFVWVKYFS
ncbi:MAG TPA: AI-2E family transporter [Firmicutes bacterium]|nr:AI-2E family transporter [Bacillota bacterium]